MDKELKEMLVKATLGSLVIVVMAFAIVSLWAYTMEEAHRRQQTHVQQLEKEIQELRKLSEVIK